MSKLHPAVTLAVKIAVTAAGIAFLLVTTDIEEVSEAIKSATPMLSAASSGVLTVALIFGALRWQQLLAADEADIGWFELFLIYLESGFFGLFLPSGLGGDVFRGWRVHSSVGGVRRTAVNLIVERLVGLCGLGILGLIALVFDPALESNARRALIVTSVFIIAGTAVLLSPLGSVAVRIAQRLRLRRISDFLDATVAQVGGYRGQRSVLPAVLALSVLQHLVAASAIWLAGSAVGLELGFSVYLAAIPLIGLLSLFPSIGGIGPREVGLAYVLQSAGASEATAVAAAAVLLGAVIARGLLGGLIYLARRPSGSA